MNELKDWRDVRCDVTINFTEKFNTLEWDGVLDHLNEVDIFCLHCVHTQNKQKLRDFQGAWNQYTLTTEGNMTPLQLFVEGATTHRLGEEEQGAQESQQAPDPALLDTSTSESV